MSVAIDLLLVDAFAAWAHRDQKRNTGDDTAPDVPYIVHPRAVRQILEVEHPDPALREPWILAAALLHDVLEDCEVHHSELSERFGEQVSAAVRALSKELRATPAAKKTDDQYWAVLAKSPLPVRQIKAADRIDNLRSCAKWPRPRLATKYLVETPAKVLPMIQEDRFLLELLERELAVIQKAYGHLLVP